MFNEDVMIFFLHSGQKPLAGFCRGKRGAKWVGKLPYYKLTFRIKTLRYLADFNKMRRKQGLFGYLKHSFLTQVR
jgi:hypothetical protein